ncbi:MAG TPA: hypothetical protein DGS69_03455 [Acinetobacter baumannii]|nr:hypothetical protein [Acinetobacter baumannii]
MFSFPKYIKEIKKPDIKMKGLIATAITVLWPTATHLLYKTSGWAQYFTFQLSSQFLAGHHSQSGMYFLHIPSMRDELHGL